MESSGSRVACYLRRALSQGEMGFGMDRCPAREILMKRSKRFAIVIGVAATGVMALGAQTASSTTGEPVDSTPPDLQLSGPKKQSPQKTAGAKKGCWASSSLRGRAST